MITRANYNCGHLCGNGYYYVSQGHTRKVKRCRWIAEKALGKALPSKSIVHHVDGNPTNDKPSNLVICPDQAYHKLLHSRQEALEATGDANAVRCMYCSEWDTENNMSSYVNKGRGSYKWTRWYHAECNRANVKKYKQ